MWHRCALKRNGHHNKHLQNAWNKYGPDAFEFGIICECEENDLDDYERYYIFTHRATDTNYGYNEESGGNLYKHHSERTKQKLSEASKGEHNNMYGVHQICSEETRCKLSIAHSGINNAFYGKHHTDEVRKKMSDAKRGMKWPIEIILSRGQNKRVRCLNNGKEFDALSLAAKWCGDTAPESISRVCYGKQKTAGTDPDTGERLKWEFIELSHTAQ